MTEQEAIKAARVLKGYCEYLRGVYCPSDCCFRVVDADGDAMCLLNVCAPSEWSLPERGLKHETK